MQDGKLVYLHNLVGAQRFKVTSDTAVPQGGHTPCVSTSPMTEAAPAKASLFVDGKKVGEGRLGRKRTHQSATVDPGPTA